jgi:hypothetical protein
MEIDLSDIDRKNFTVNEHIVNRELVYLVQPVHVGVNWTQENKIFRSSVWDSDGNLVSGGFPKFTNWGENPINFPVPTSLKNTSIVEKIDGSLLIVSRWRGNYILRTRGTVDATKLDNGYELETFKRNILPKLDFECGQREDTWIVSFLFEWVSPTQRIILNYGDVPQWFLVGLVWHNNYALATQATLNDTAQRHELLRPSSYTFPTIEDLMVNVERWKGKEGVVIYSGDGQVLHKVKALEYLTKHRFKSEATLENTLNLYFSMGRPEYKEFEKKLIEAFDYECFEMIRGFISVIYDASKEVQKIVDGIDLFIKNTLIHLPSRREQSLKILSSYGNTNRSSFVFTRLDGKSLTNDQLIKLFWQVLKK